MQVKKLQFCNRQLQISETWVCGCSKFWFCFSDFQKKEVFELWHLHSWMTFFQHEDFLTGKNLGKGQLPPPPPCYCTDGNYHGALELVLFFLVKFISGKTLQIFTCWRFVLCRIMRLLAVLMQWQMRHYVNRVFWEK